MRTTDPSGQATDPELEKIRQKKLEQLMTDDQQTASPGPSRPVELSDDEIQGFLSQNDTALLDFWAPWCGPCQVIAPVLEEIAQEMAGQVAIGKINVDEHPAIAQRYQVQGIPTLILAKEGQVVDRVVGAAPKAQLQARLQQLADA